MPTQFMRRSSMASVTGVAGLIHVALECMARLAVVLAFGAAAATGAAAASGAQQTVRESIPLKLANRQIIMLRGPIAGITAKERVTAINERIEQALAAEKNPVVTLEDVPEGTRVLLGGKFAFLVAIVDIDSEAGETTQLVAQVAKKRLEQAILERREQETPLYLATAAGFSGVATVVYGLLLWLAWRCHRWVPRRLARVAAAHSQKVQVAGIQLLDPGHVLMFTARVVIVLTWAIAIALTVAWLTFVLERFPYTRPWGEHLEGNLFSIVTQVLIAMAGAVPGLVFVGIIGLIASMVIGLARGYFTRVEQGKLDVGWIDADTARPTRRIFNFVIWVFAAAMAYPYLPGSDTEAFKGLSVLVGLMVSIGGASVVGHAFSGLILMYTRSFRTGDFVRIGEVEGTVHYMGMFTTRIRTGLGEEITLPNSGIMTTTIKNYSRAVPGTGYVVDTVVTIGYSAPWRQVHAMLEEAARRTSDIAQTPAPFVRQTALSDFYVEYRLVAYTPAETPTQRIEVLDRLHANIQDVFNEHGVQIMSPHYMTDTKEPQVVPKDQWYAAPAKAPEKQ